MYNKEGIIRLTANIVEADSENEINLTLERDYCSPHGFANVLGVALGKCLEDVVSKSESELTLDMVNEMANELVETFGEAFAEIREDIAKKKMWV